VRAKVGAFLAPLDALLLRELDGESAERSATREFMSTERISARFQFISARWRHCAIRGASGAARREPSALTGARERSTRRALAARARARSAAALPRMACMRLPPTRQALVSSSAAQLHGMPAEQR
jgi:hypothetical protein